MSPSLLKIWKIVPQPGGDKGHCTCMHEGPWPLSFVWEALKHEEDEDACHYVLQQHCRSQARELRDRADLPPLQFSTIKAFMRNNRHSIVLHGSRSMVLIPIESEWIYCENLLLNVIIHLSLSLSSAFFSTDSHLRGGRTCGNHNNSSSSSRL